MADKFQKVVREQTTEVRLVEEYNKAKSRFIEGNTFAQKREWDSAIAAFEDAAHIFGGVAARSQSENGKKAAEAAQQARNAANLAREYQKRQ
jgi:hypothetical protein